MSNFRFTQKPLFGDEGETQKYIKKYFPIPQSTQSVLRALYNFEAIKSLIWGWGGLIVIENTVCYGSIYASWYFLVDITPQERLLEWCMRPPYPPMYLALSTGSAKHVLIVTKNKQSYFYRVYILVHLWVSYANHLKSTDIFGGV